jgi:hypothetical protein
VVHACNSSSHEFEEGELQVPGMKYLASSRPAWASLCDPVSENKNDNDNNTHTQFKLSGLRMKTGK